MDRKKRNFFILLAVIVILIAALYIIFKNLDTTDNGDLSPDGRTAAPAFTLKDESGRSYSLSDFRGKNVIINFWGSWCVYCIMEMPDFQNAHYTFQEEDETVIISINDTSTEKSYKDVLDFIHLNNYDMLILFDRDGKVADEYGVKGYPTTFIVDSEGYIYAYQPGSLTEQTLYDVIDRLTGEDQDEQ